MSAYTMIHEKTKQQLIANGLFTEFENCYGVLAFVRRRLGVDHLTNELIEEKDTVCDTVYFNKWKYANSDGIWNIAEKNRIISSLFKLWDCLNETSIPLKLNYENDVPVPLIQIRRSSGVIQSGWLEKTTQLIYRPHHKQFYIRVIFIDQSNFTEKEKEKYAFSYVNDTIVNDKIENQTTIIYNFLKTKIIPLKEFVEYNVEFCTSHLFTVPTISEKMMETYEGYSPEKTLASLQVINQELKKFVEISKNNSIVNSEQLENFWNSVIF